MAPPVANANLPAAEAPWRADASKKFLLRWEMALQNGNLDDWTMLVIRYQQLLDAGVALPHEIDQLFVNSSNLDIQSFAGEQEAQILEMAAVIGRWLAYYSS